MRAPFLKLGTCWWIMNYHKSMELLFSEGLGGGLISSGGTFFTHKLFTNKELNFFISLNLHFLKFDESFTFFSNSIIFFFDFSFYAIAQKCCLQQSWGWYDPGTWQLYEDWQGKSLFTEPYNFRHDSWKIDLELVELGS